MKKITHEFSQLHRPVKAFLVYNHLTDERDVRVEAFDTDEKGWPMNAHPLSVNEMKMLAKSLSVSTDVHTRFLECKGVFPSNLLYVDARENGYALWYTPAQKINLLFKKELTIPCGEANVPPLVWIATASDLHLYALKTDSRPTGDTPLFYAPFFNIHPGGMVCMGTVDIDIDEDCNLVDFMNQWEEYFWASYFTHSIGGAVAITGNIVSLWQELTRDPQKPFPLEVLKKNGKTINDLIL
jgi:PRTRC genetic system protein B